MKSKTTTGQNKQPADWDWFWSEVIDTFIGRISWRLYLRYRARTYYKLLSQLKIGSALELGGGSGYLSKLLSEKFGFSITIVDNNPEAYKIWRKISRIGRYIKADFFNFSSKKKYDLVFSDGVVEHFPAKEKRIKAIRLHRQLSKNYVIIFVPKRSFLTEKIARPNPNKCWQRHYTLQELKQEVKKAGLKIIKTGEDLHTVGLLAKK